MNDVLQWALPERVAPLLAPGLPAAIAARLQRSPRLSARCSAWLAEALGDADFAALSEVERDLATAGPDALQRAANLAGAVWHSRHIAGLVLSHDIAAFVTACGETARTVALRHVAFAVPSVTAVPLEQAVRQDGTACLAAWIDSLPGGVASRLWLMVSRADDVAPAMAHRQHGPAIVRRVAAEALT